MDCFAYISNQQEDTDANGDSINYTPFNGVGAEDVADVIIVIESDQPSGCGTVSDINIVACCEREWPFN